MAWRGTLRLGTVWPGAVGQGRVWRGFLLTREKKVMPRKSAPPTEVGPVSNGAVPTLEFSQPYIASIMIEGVSDLLFHAWNCESVAAKATASKNSAAKKSDDLESYIYRDDTGGLCLPGEYLRQSIIHAAKYRQDPRSPRKSAMDLFKAGVVTLTPLAPLGADTWDYEHKCRVTIQRQGITRTRPAFKVGWQAVFELLVNLPEYISAHIL